MEKVIEIKMKTMGEPKIIKRSCRKESLVYMLLLFCTSISILTTIGIAVTLVVETIPFFQKVSFKEFITGTKWTPLFEPQHFGVLPLVCGTLLITFTAGVVALPIGLATAVYLSEYASDRLRRVVKPFLEVLAGVPTVVYGYFALTFVTPLLQKIFPGMNIFNALSAGIVVGIMIMPMVASLSEDSLMAVPHSIREAAYALGSTRFEVAGRVMVPSALSGIMASFILALSRAIGETMIVTIAAGATPKLTLNPLESIQTMTAYIVQVSLGDTPHGTIEYHTLFAVGMLLFLFTFGMNIFAKKVASRYGVIYQ